MKVWFQNSRGIEREIANVTSFDEAFRTIYQFLHEHNYKSYYTRTWEENGRTKVDVGSWSEFFYIEGLVKNCDNESSSKDS